MKFPNARKGVGRIFAAEIFGLIAAIALIGTAIFGIAEIKSLTTESAVGTVTSGIGFLALSLISGVLMILAFIFNIIGISAASKDESAFKTALVMVFVGLLASVVAAIFGNNTTVKGIMDAISNISNLIITVMVIQGIRNLALRLNDNDMDRKGGNLFKIIILIYALIIIAGIIVMIFSNMAASIVAGVFMAIGGVLSVIQYIMYLSYLSKAKRMLG